MAHGLYDDSLFRTDTDLTEDSDTEEFEDENIGSKRNVSLKFQVTISFVGFYVDSKILYVTNVLSPKFVLKYAKLEIYVLLYVC